MSFDQPGSSTSTVLRFHVEGVAKMPDRARIIATAGESDGVLNDRANIVVLVDEAHRTQEGDLGIKMRTALPNASTAIP